MTRITTALFCAAAFVGGPLQAAPVEWSAGSGGNGHWYELVAGPSMTWTAASEAASTMTHMGGVGHLATLTSAEEWAFLVDVVNPGAVRAWLGGSDAASEGRSTWAKTPASGPMSWNMPTPSPRWCPRPRRCP